MRSVLALLLLIPTFALGQSWVLVSLQADQYAGETTWEIADADSNIVATSPAYTSYGYEETLVFIPPGDYTFTIFDSFGDGICCGFGEGYFELYNTCGVDVAVDNFDTTQLEIPITLLPCPPPPAGCLDPQAVNYIPEAIVEETCVYPVTFQLDLNGPHPDFNIPEVNSSVNGWCGSCWAMSDEDNNGVWEITVNMPEGLHLWKFSADNWAVQELPVGVSESPCFLFDNNGFVNRTILVDGPTTLPPFCWESCLPCGGIPGCTDPNGLDYNPWATFDTGCLIIEDANCTSDETQITVTVIPDNYPQETSWYLSDDAGEMLYSVEPGEYQGVPAGIPIHVNVCATTGSTINFDLNDTYGDGLNGAQWGGIDGTVIIGSCEQPIWVLPEPDFEYGLNVELLVEECQAAEGCTDPMYLEYDPGAINDDGSCETEIVYGCTDELALNYDSIANTLETADSCMFTLTLTDGVGDGWFGSWMGVIQGDQLFGPFNMGPDDGFEEEFYLPLASEQEVEVLFFTGGNAETTAAQCGFYIEGPQGIVVEGGTNPWNDAIKKFPFRYSGIPLCEDFCIPEIIGCTNPEACNYNPEANVDDECTLPIEFYNCDNQCITDSDQDGVCDQLEIVGCTDPTAYNYNPAATDNGDCEPIVFGCTDPTQFNYDPAANTDNDSCIPFIYGCTDPTAVNYDEDANTDSGGCIEAIAGCMDPEAFNFDAGANVSDIDLCLYDAGCITGPGNPYWANDQCYSWVISIDPYCCESGWDDVCVEMYGYCQDGLTSVPTLGRVIKIYPNPTRGEINIQTPDVAVTTIYNYLGQELITTTDNVINLPTAGVYVVMVNYNGYIVKQTIVKE